MSINLWGNKNLPIKQSINGELHLRKGNNNYNYFLVNSGLMTPANPSNTNMLFCVRNPSKTHTLVLDYVSIWVLPLSTEYEATFSICSSITGMAINSGTILGNAIKCLNNVGAQSVVQNSNIRSGVGIGSGATDDIMYLSVRLPAIGATAEYIEEYFFEEKLFTAHPFFFGETGGFYLFCRNTVTGSPPISCTFGWYEVPNSDLDSFI